jgi:phosphoglycolate phosphatase-like HAD superfamily hydrolase
LIGDSTWDCIAAGKLGVPSFAVRTGGFSVEELLDAGAERVFDSLREFAENLDATVPARPSDSYG